MATKNPKKLLELLLAQDGAEYVFGTEVSASESNPQAFDCSELVEWGCARLKVTPTMPDGAIYQVRHCRDNGLLIPVEQGIHTAGALLFYFSDDPFTGGRPGGAHVAVSQGNGKTFEARSTKCGVHAFSALNRGWTHAGLIPGLDYEEPATTPATPATAAEEIKEIKGKNYRVTAEFELNIRSGPGPEYEVVGKLAGGRVVVNPDTAGWLPILLENNTIGWVSKKFMELAPTSVAPGEPSPPEPPPGPTPGEPSTPEPPPGPTPGEPSTPEPPRPIGGELNPDQLREIVPALGVEDAESMASALNPVLREAQIDTPLRQAAFMAQLAYETQGFSRFIENLFYRADRLLEVFGRYFTADEAQKYARQPEKIANRVYANRLGNGDEGSGDGWRYRGRGFIQITGKDNYSEAGKSLNLDLVGKPELAADLKVGARIAGWYWTKYGLNSYADNRQFDTITKKINGGLNGLYERQAYYKKAKEVLQA